MTDVEDAIQALANGFVAIWVMHGEQISAQLDECINEQISYDFDEEVWLEIIGRLDTHSDLAEYLRRRVIFNFPPQSYVAQKLDANASNEERLRWTWNELHAGGRDFDAIRQEIKLSGGEQAIILAAQYEEQLVLKGLLWTVEFASEDDPTVLHAVIADAYDHLGYDEKWTLMPMFFNEKMTRRQSRFLKERKANDTYYKIFLQRVKADGLNVIDLKAQFLASGYGDLMPCLHIVQPDYDLANDTNDADRPAASNKPHNLRQIQTSNSAEANKRSQTADLQSHLLSEQFKDPFTPQTAGSEKDRRESLKGINNRNSATKRKPIGLKILWIAIAITFVLLATV